MKLKKKGLTNQMIMGSACFLFCVVFIIPLISCYYVNQCVEEEAKAQKKRYDWTKLGEQLEDASDYLTSEARQYVITGDSGHFYNYWEEVCEVRARDDALEKLEKGGLYSREETLLKKAKKNSDELIKTEELAMKMKMDVSGVTINHNAKKKKYKERVEHVILPAAYKKMTKSQKEKQAIALLYDDAYEEAKQSIMIPIHAFQKSINERMDTEVRKKGSGRAMALKVQTGSLCLLPVIIGAWIVLIAKLYVRPVREYTKAMASKKEKQIRVLPSGVYEMRYLGKEFNHLSERLQKESERAKQASQAKTEFLAKMSHEFRTPLNSISGYLYLLEKSPLTAKQKDYCHSMHLSSQGLLKLIDQVLDLSKIESGQMVFEYRPMKIKNMIMQVEKMMRPTAQEKGLLMAVEFDEKLPKTVIGDEFRLKQILLNLVGNGIKFSKYGKITLKVCLLEKKEQYDRVFFSVTDQGIGIPKDRIGEIFQDFVQSDTTITRRFGGTGLGLPITKKMIEEFNHGKDTLHVKSKEGQGSCFFFTMNFQKAEQKKKETEHSNEKKEIKFCGQKILLVDDDTMNLRVEKEILFQAGLEVKTADSGKNAIKEAREALYDLILVDIRMPDMNGYELAENIRKIVGYEKIPIVALTADAIGETREKARKAGMDYCLMKPLRPGQLLHVLNHELVLEQEDTSIFLGEELLKTVGDDRQTYKELIEMFLKSQEKQFHVIRQAMMENDDETVESVLHKMKGSAGSLYCNLFYITLCKMHQKAKGGQRIKLDVLMDVWEQTKQVLIKEIKNEVRDDV